MQLVDYAKSLRCGKCGDRSNEAREFRENSWGSITSAGTLLSLIPKDGLNLMGNQQLSSFLFDMQMFENTCVPRGEKVLCNNSFPPLPSTKLEIAQYILTATAILFYGSGVLVGVSRFCRTQQLKQEIKAKDNETDKTNEARELREKKWATAMHCAALGCFIIKESLSYVSKAGETHYLFDINAFEGNCIPQDNNGSKIICDSSFPTPPTLDTSTIQYVFTMFALFFQVIGLGIELKSLYRNYQSKQENKAQDKNQNSGSEDDIAISKTNEHTGLLPFSRSEAISSLAHSLAQSGSLGCSRD